MRGEANGHGQISISSADASMLTILLLSLLAAFGVAWVFTTSLSLEKISALSRQQTTVWRSIENQVDYILSTRELHELSRSALESSQAQIRQNLQDEAKIEDQLQDDFQSLNTFPFSLLISDRDYEALIAAKINPHLRDLIVEISTAPNAVVRNHFMHWDFASEVSIRSGHFYQPLRDRNALLARIHTATIGNYFYMLAGIALIMILGTILVWFRLLRPSIKARENAQAELEAVFDNLPGFVVSIDPQKNIIFVNKTYRDARPPLPDMRTKSIPIKDVTSPEEWAMIKPNIERAISGKRTKYDVQVQLYGEKRAAQAIYVPVFGKNGKVERVTALIIDIQDRFLAEQALRNNEESLRITLNSIGDGVISTDTHGTITRINDVASSLTGWPMEDAVGKHLSDVFQLRDNETREPLGDTVKQITETDEIADWAPGKLLISKDKSEYLIADSGAPIYSGDRELAGVVIVFRDITTEQHLSQQLAQADKMRALGQLAGGIAHDFNNVLAGILGSGELIELDQGNKLNAKGTVRLQQVISSAKRAAALVEKLTAFSVTSPQEFSELNIETIVADAINILENTIDKRIDVRNNPSLPNPLVLGNESRLCGIILNLLINAVQSIPDEGTIFVVSENWDVDQKFCDQQQFEIEPGEYAGISIRDTGIGIAPNNLRRMFEPFFTTKPIDKGTGLGLAEVYGTVVDHKGAICVDSEVGEGTRISILFPIARPADEKKSTQPPPEKNATGPLHVLFVDDEAGLREIAESTLKILGHTSTLVSNGKEAISVFEKHFVKIDLVILDLNMPDVSGAHVLERLVKIDSAVQVIIATGFGNDLEIPDGSNDNVLLQLKKPYGMSELRAALSLHKKKAG